MQHEAQKLFPETSRVNAENMDLFRRLTDASAELGEAYQVAPSWAHKLQVKPPLLQHGFFSRF
jgi:hypothetical protein